MRRLAVVLLMACLCSVGAVAFSLESLDTAKRFLPGFNLDNIMRNAHHQACELVAKDPAKYTCETACTELGTQINNPNLGTLCAVCCQDHSC